METENIVNRSESISVSVELAGKFSLNFRSENPSVMKRAYHHGTDEISR